MTENELKLYVNVETVKGEKKLLHIKDAIQEISKEASHISSNLDLESLSKGTQKEYVKLQNLVDKVAKLDDAMSKLYTESPLSKNLTREVDSYNKQIDETSKKLEKLKKDLSFAKAKTLQFPGKASQEEYNKQLTLIKTTETELNGLYAKREATYARIDDMMNKGEDVIISNITKYNSLLAQAKVAVLDIENLNHSLYKQTPEGKQTTAPNIVHWGEESTAIDSADQNVKQLNDDLAKTSELTAQATNEAEKYNNVTTVTRVSSTDDYSPYVKEAIQNVEFLKGSNFNSVFTDSFENMPTTEQVLEEFNKRMLETAIDVKAVNEAMQSSVNTTQTWRTTLGNALIGMGDEIERVAFRFNNVCENQIPELADVYVKAFKGAGQTVQNFFTTVRDWMWNAAETQTKHANALALFGDTYTELVEKIEQSRIEIQYLQAQQESLLGAGVSIDNSMFVQLDNQVQQLANDTANMVDQVAIMGQAMGIISKEDSAFNVYNLDYDFPKLAETSSAVDEVGNSFRRTAQSGQNLIITIGQLSSKILSGFIGALKRLGNALKSVVSQMFHFKKSANGIGGTLKKGFKMFLMYGLGIRSVYRAWNKLRSAVKEGTNVLVKEDSLLNASLSEVTSALKTLKYTLAGAFEPVINIVAPILTKFINLLIDVANKIGMVIASLSGQGVYQKARRIQEDYAKSLDKTAGSAANASKQLAGFDKLNVLNSDKGGGGGADGLEDYYEEVEVASDLFEKIKSMFSFEGLYDLGKTIAESINGVFDNIQWSKIKSKALEIGQKISTLINGFVDNFHFDKLGSTIAEGFNTLFNFLYGFVTTLHWREIGEGIGSALTSFFDTFDLVKVAQTISSTINGLGQTIAGFLTKADFTLIGTKIGGFLDEIFTGGEDGQGGIDWKALGGTLHLAFTKLCDMVIAGLKEIHWDEIGKKIGELLKEFFEGDPNPFVKLAEVFWTVLQSALELEKGIFDANPIAGIIVGGVAGAIALYKFKSVASAVFGLFGGTAATGGAVAAGEAVGGGFLVGVSDVLKTGATLVAGFVAGQTAGAGAGALLENATGGTEEQVGWWEQWLGHPIKFAQEEVKVFSDELKGLDVYLNEAGNLTINLTDIYEKMRDDGLAPTQEALETLESYFADGGETVEMIKSEFYTLNEALGDFAYQNDLLNKSPLYVKTLYEYMSGNIGKETLEVYAEMEGQTANLEADIYRIQNGIVDLGTVTSSSTAGMVDSIEQVGNAYDTTSSKVTSSQETQARAIQATKDAVSEYAQRTTEGLNTVYNNAHNNVVDLGTVTSEQSQVIIDSVDSAKTEVIDLGTVTGEQSTVVIESVREISGGYSEAMGTMLQDNVDFKTNVALSLSELTSTASEQSDAMTGIFTGLHDTLKNVFNGIISGSESMGNGVSDGINEVTDSLNTFDFTLPDWLPGVGGKSLSFNIPKLNKKISIPRLAQGGVIPANNEFLAVLGDQKQGTNIEAPLDTIKQAVAEVMMQMGGGSSDNGDIVINIDGDEVFRVVRDKNNEYKKSNGKSAFA